MAYFTQNIPIPGVSLPSGVMATPRFNLMIPGDQLEYDPITIQFLVDEEMINYSSIYEWMLNNAYNKPEKVEDFFSDATLLIYSANFTVIKKIFFNGCSPSVLSEISFDTTVPDSRIIQATLTMNITHFTIEGQELPPNTF